MANICPTSWSQQTVSPEVSTNCHQHRDLHRPKNSNEQQRQIWIWMCPRKTAIFDNADQNCWISDQCCPPKNLGKQQFSMRESATWTLEFVNLCTWILPFNMIVPLPQLIISLKVNQGKFNNAQKYVPMRSWTCSDKTRNKMNRFGFGKDDKKSDCRIMF